MRKFEGSSNRATVCAHANADVNRRGPQAIVDSPPKAVEVPLGGESVATLGSVSNASHGVSPGKQAWRVRRLTSRRVWENQYIARLRVTDVFVVVMAVAFAQLIRFGELQTNSPAVLSYTGVSVALAGLWIAFLAIFRTRSTRVIGNGAEEYRRIVSATFRLFGVIAILSLLFKIDIARLYLAIAFPFGLLGLLISRWVWRKGVAAKRSKGKYQTAVLIVGSRTAAVSMAKQFESSPASGYTVVGMCLPGFEAKRDAAIVDGYEIPVLGDEHSVLEAIETSGADTVAVTAAERLGTTGIRKMVWDLEKKNVDLVVAPGVVDVAGPRLEMRPVAGFPLIHIEKPRYHGSNRFAKTAFDTIVATLILIAIAPVMVTVALLVKFHDGGPVFYRHLRVGQNGKTFKMWKFRSMVQNADQRMAEVRRELGMEDATFFKSAKDPRITPIGRFIRRTSIDELPQLFNVLSRHMSIVGPRPLVEGEGKEIAQFVERRMLVRPGMTGLWQVSGRSSLSEENRVRLDLFYVENWSMTQDLIIIGKTVRAVLKNDGAF